MWKLQSILLTLIFINPTGGYAQIDRARSWYFGQNIELHFSRNNQLIIRNNRQSFTYEGTGTWCNKQGNLLYYTDCCRLFDSLNTQINTNFMLGGDGSSSQVTFLTSINDTILHIFGASAAIYDPNFQLGGMNYSCYNFIEKKWLYKRNKLRKQAAECQAHVNHQNGRWQWAVSHSRLGDTLFSYLISDDGLETCPVVSHAGPFYDDWTQGQGIIKFSPNGKYLAISSFDKDKVTICEFNNQTGGLRELFQINIDGFAYGLEFTRNNKLLATALRTGDLWEFNISKMEYFSVENSRRKVYDTAGDNDLYQLQNAPDGNIYMALPYSNRLGKLTLINDSWRFEYTPNLFGTKKCYGGFPNFNASYFYTPALNFTYTRNCETNTFKFTASDTIGANNWQWHFTKGNIIQTKSGKLITHTFSDTGHWQVRCIAGNGSRNDTIFKTLEIQKPLQRQYLGEDILFAAGANISGNLSINNFQNPHCVHWQKLGDTIEKLGYTYTYNDTGIFVCKATNKVFCTYMDTIKVRVCDSFARAAIIERNGDSLFTNTYAAKYQWFVNDTAIQNGTKPSLKLVRIGKYKLRTWNVAGCDSFSADFEVDKLGLQYFNNSQIKLFPNPNNGEFNIISEKGPIQSVVIYDLIGNKLFKNQPTNTTNVSIQTNLKAGIYVLKINDYHLQKIMIN